VHMARQMVVRTYEVDDNKLDRAEMSV
jgi:hypothetical protein